MVIYLDMDGVMTEWIEVCCQLFGEDYEGVMARWTKGQFDLRKVLGLTSKEFWGIIDQRGSDYWAKLPRTPWARRLWDGCNSLAPTYFLTAPSWEPASLAGKLEWMQEFVGAKSFRDYIITEKKYLLAKPEAVLVDDNDEVVQKFVQAGGRGVVFPRIWNSRHEVYAKYKDDTDKYVLDILLRIHNYSGWETHTVIREMAPEECKPLQGGGTCDEQAHG